MSLAAMGPAGAVWLTWHFLLLGLSTTGLLLERLLRGPNAHARSVLLRLTLALSIALPVVCAGWLARPLSTPASSASVFPQDSAGGSGGAKPPAVDWSHVAIWRPLVADLKQVPDNLLPAETKGVPPETIVCASFLVISMLTSTVLFGRFVSAHVRCSILRRSAIPLAPEDEKRYREIAAAMNVPPPRALRAAQLESPVLLGFLRPLILLPAGMALRDEFFSHELTHLRRHDLNWHLFARLATMLMPLQPGFWILRKALERADEDVCDDAVLVCGADAAAYAKLLLDVAESQHAPDPELCLPMAAFRSQLERRLSRLLDVTRPLARRLSIFVLCLGLGPLLIAGFIAGAIYLDTERPAMAFDHKAPTTTPLPPVGKSVAANAPVLNSAANEAGDTKTLQKDLLDAQQDAARRQVLYDSTKFLPDADFVGVLEGMQRAPAALTSTGGDILEKQQERQQFLDKGMGANDPQVRSLDFDLAQLHDRYLALLRGAHTALKIDADMAAASVKILQDKVQTLKAPEPNQVGVQDQLPGVFGQLFKVNADLVTAGAKVLQNNIQMVAPLVSQAGTQKELVGDVGRLYHAIVYTQTSAEVPKLAPTSWQFIADMSNNTFPVTGGSVSLPDGATWKTNPVDVVMPDLLVGAHYLYVQGFPSKSDLLSHFPNGKYAFNIQPGGSATPYSVSVPFTGTVDYPPLAPVITNPTWNAGALVLDPNSATISYTNYPGATMTWEILIPGKTYVMSAGGGGTSLGSLNLTGMLSYGQTYQAQLRFINRDQSSTESDPAYPKDYGYSTIMARIVEFTIKTPPQ